MRPGRVTARRANAPIRLVATIPGRFSRPVIVAVTSFQRLRGIKLAPPGYGVLLAASAVHGFGLETALTAVALDNTGRVLARRVLRPGTVWRCRGAGWIMEFPELSLEEREFGRLDTHPHMILRMQGTLILCGTPIGNMGDASPRLAEALRTADIIYAEDTRRSSFLLQTLGLSRPLRSYFAGNEAARAEELGARLEAGETVALLTDAGMPAISDPGLTAARAAHFAGARVTVIPGPSAVTAALAVSGLPSDRFVFEGFLPRKKKGRAAVLADLEEERRTIVLFAAPSRVIADLEDLASVLGGNRPIAITRELTKVHEEVWRGRLGPAVEDFKARASIKGELTIVIGPKPSAAVDLHAAAAAARDAIRTGMTPSEAVREAAAAHRVSRRLLYQEVIAPPAR